MASGPHIEANSVEPWRIRMLEGGRWSTNFTRSVWPKYMADQPHGGCSAVLLHINVVVKLGNHLSDTINTPHMLYIALHTLHSRLSTCKDSSALVVA
jgi:hypothetical protein